jgi:protein TonB
MLMPRELFGDVTDSSITLGTRKWYTVPVSLAFHVAIISVLIIAPLMATGTLPLLRDTTPMWMPVEPSKPPASPLVRPKSPDLPREINPEAAPIVEPTAILQELDFDRTFESEAPDLVAGGGTVEGSAVVAPPPPVETIAAAREVSVRVGRGVQAPERVTYVAPAYPPIALSARLQGLVIIEATINTAGHVQNARVLRTASPLFTEAALSAVRQWTYTPTLLNGIPVSVIMTVTVQFRLQ